uniref:VWFA domain-containing protein n=1 Tax=Terrapene triunguis TaxID=2587831 RepID=A0A674IR47_9SAUR
LTGDCLTPAVLAPSRGFSVEVEDPITFQEAAAGFGQSVVQFGSVSGPKLSSPPSVLCSEGHLLTPCLLMPQVCVPMEHQACGENMYVSHNCYPLQQSFSQLQHIPDTQPECPKHVTDIALLIDGSGSIASVDFEKMKMFVSEIIKRFRKTDTQFALMQYSDEFTEHFDFSQYKRSSNPDDLVGAVVQLRGWTHTATAIRKVVRELFTSGRGARGEATKILMVITDGEKTGDILSYSDVIPEAERAGIIHYAIGVSCGCAEN